MLLFLDPFEPFLNAISSRLSQNTTLALGILALVVLGAGPVLNLVQSLDDLRFGKKRAELEKLSWEILKIRYEVEVLKKDHQVDLGTELEAHPLAVAAPAGPQAPHARPRAHRHQPPSPWVLWLQARRPWLASGLLYAAVVTSTLATLLFFFMSVSFISNLRLPMSDPNHTDAGLVGFALAITALLGAAAVSFVRQKVRLTALMRDRRPQA